MQLFGLVNTLLANDPTSLRKNLRYSKAVQVVKLQGVGCLVLPIAVCVIMPLANQLEK